jgi:uncharacterized repeat protein (TIGR02543 family)
MTRRRERLLSILLTATLLLSLPVPTACAEEVSDTGMEIDTADAQDTTSSSSSSGTGSDTNNGNSDDANSGDSAGEDKSAEKPAALVHRLTETQYQLLEELWLDGEDDAEALQELNDALDELDADALSELSNILDALIDGTTQMDMDTGTRLQELLFPGSAVLAVDEESSTTITENTGEPLKITEDTTLILHNVTIDTSETYFPAISITNRANVTLILDGDNTVNGGKGSAGIYVAEDATLTIKTIDGNNNTGSLTAQGGHSMIGNSLVSVPADIAGKTEFSEGKYCAGAGIGGNGVWYANDGTWISKPHFGTVTIQSGTITAVGGQSRLGRGAGAGIGSGGGTNISDTSVAESFRGTIQINGGNIKATGGAPSESPFDWTMGGAGIGSGANAGGSSYTVGNQVKVKISDGTIKATGWGDGAGIGGGANVDSGNITISGGIIKANGGYESTDGSIDGAQDTRNGGAGIGGGDMGGVDSITITGGNITATATGAAAGIGSGYGGSTPESDTGESDTGCITITGGTVEAKGGGSPNTGNYGGAGIGSGGASSDYSSDVKDIIISGGKVTATATGVGAGIGSGCSSTVGNITISGDSTEVTATGGCFYSNGVQSGSYGGAGIGSGNTASCGDIIISGGTVTAEAIGAAAGIGGGYSGDVDSITISGGKQITATGGYGWVTTTKSGKTTKYTSTGGAGIGGGDHGYCGAIAISGGEQITATAIGPAAGIGSGNNGNIGGAKNEDGSITYGTITISGGKITATGGCYHDTNWKKQQYFGGAGIGGGQSGNLDAIIITGGDITAKAIGAGAGIGAGRDGTINTITISGEDTVIDATGGSGWSNDKPYYRSGGAGIGGGDNKANGVGAITISGGNVTATATGAAAGIGGGCGGNGGNITISGGTVIATGGRVQGNNSKTQTQWNAGAGIGGGDQAGVNSVTVSGGTVTATAGGAAAGIGSGTGGDMPTGQITISGTANVTAYGGTYDSVGGAGLGGGYPCINNKTATHKYSFGTITIKGQATVRAYAGLNAQAIGVGTGYENGTEENVTNQITIDGTGVDVWMFNQDTTKGAFYGQTNDGTDIVRVDGQPTELIPENDIGVIWYTTTDTMPTGGKAVYANDEKAEPDMYTWAYEAPTVSVSSGSALLTSENVPSSFNLGNWATTYPKPVTVTFDSRGGSNVDPQRVAYGGYAEEPTKPEREGYTFGGWYVWLDANNDGVADDDELIEKYDFGRQVTEDITLYAKWTLNQHTVTFDANGGTLTGAATETVQHREKATKPTDPTKEGYTFDKWYTTKADDGTLSDEYDFDLPVIKNITLYAGWTPTPSTPTPNPNPNPPPTPDPTPGGGNDDDDDDSPTPTPTPSVAEQVGMEGPTVNDLNTTDHFAYIKGYEDGTVRAGKYITRAQVATIYYRLLTDEAREAYFKETNDFPDVSDDYWANKAISSLANLGIVEGFKDGYFRPNAYITRAQFAAIAARFSDPVAGMAIPFTDVPDDYWAADLIAFAADVGWVDGYGDGTFRPANNITRGAAMKLINNVLRRLVDADGLLPEAIQWTDNNVGDTFYYVVLEATNSHDYTRRDETTSIVENWTALTPNRTWNE